MYYHVKTKFQQTQPDGTIKTKSEELIIDVEFFAQAEMTATLNYTNEEDVDVYSIKRLTRLKEIINTPEDGDTIYIATLKDVYVDEASGKEKELKYDVLVYATDTNKANQIINVFMQQGYGMKLHGIHETKITEVI